MSQLLGQLERKPERVVQLERLVARDRLAVFRRHLLELFHALAKGALEPRRLLIDPSADRRRLFRQLRIRLAHHVDDVVDENANLRTHPQSLGMESRPADEPPEHIPAAFVARGHPIGHRKACSANVIGHDSLRKHRLLFREPANLLDDR